MPTLPGNKNLETKNIIQKLGNNKITDQKNIIGIDVFIKKKSGKVSL
jgi:hypothetical protein